MSKLTQASLAVIPWLLIAISFVLLLIVQLGGSSSSTLNSVYFLQLDVGHEGVYRLYLWNYCSGIYINGVPTINYCSARAAGFSFDPKVISSISSGELANTAQGAFSAYRSATSWMWTAHFIAFLATLITMLSSILGTFMRFAKHMAFFSASVAELFATMATITSTVVFAQLVSSINKTLSSSSVTASTSATMLGLSWLSAILLNLGALLYILLALRAREPKGIEISPNDNRNSSFPTAFPNLPTSSLRNLKPLTLADKLHCEKLTSKIHDKPKSKRDSSFSFIDSAPRRPRDSFMSRISEHLSENGRPNSQSSFRSTASSMQKPYTESARSSSTTLVPRDSTSSLRVIDTVTTTATKGHLGTKVLVAAGQGRKSVVFAMEKNRFETFDQREIQAQSIQEETTVSLSPRSTAKNDVLFDTHHTDPSSDEQSSDLKDLYPHCYGDFAQSQDRSLDEQDGMEELDLVSPIWGQREPAPEKNSKGRSAAKTRRDELVTASIRAGPWGLTPAVKRQDKVKEDVRRKRWSNASSAAEDKDARVLGREWR